MSSYPPPPQPPLGNDWRLQRKIVREQQRMQREAYRAQYRSLRRSSIVGPLLLIALGTLVLLAQMGRLSWPRLFTTFAHWWPLLLVLVGAVRLVEWLLDRPSGQDGTAATPYPRRMMGGGVITLLVLLAVGGVVASAVARHGSRAMSGKDALFNQDDIDEFLGDKHESDQSLLQALPPGSGVTVDCPRGDVTVNGTSLDGQIHIDLHKEVFTRSDRDADRKAQELSPQIHTDGDRVVVSVPSLDGARGNLTISLPPGTPITANANRGDVRVNRLTAPLMITANHGDVDLTDISGPVTLHINNGDSSLTAHTIIGPVNVAGHGKDITLTNIGGPVAMTGEFFGTTHLEKVAGPVQFHTSRTDLQLVRLDGELEISSSSDLSADQAVGPMILNTRNRNITLERVSGDVSITDRNGSVDLVSAPPLGNVSVENRNGSVNVTLPTGASFSVAADTTNGNLENDFSLPNGGGENHPSVNGTVGHGGPMIRITTSQGDVALKHSAVAPLAPTIPPLPAIPPVPPRLSTLPKSAQDAIREAQRSAAEAQREAQRAVREAQQQATKAARQKSKDQSEDQP